MYSKINKYIKEWIQNTVTTEPIQSGYIASANNIDLRKSAILIEPRTDDKSLKNIRWQDSEYKIKIWIMVMIAQDYETSIEEAERIIGGDDDEKVGLLSAMAMLREDETFRHMTGIFAQKQWRILSNNPLSYDMSVGFGISQTTSSRIVTTTLDVTVNFEQEK